jgi:hypothetical protein
VGGDLAGGLEHALEQRLVVGVDLLHQAHLVRPAGPARGAGEGHLAREALGDDLAEALQGADVGGHADVDLLHAEEGVLRRVAQVAGRHEVDRPADDAALHRRDDRHARLLQRGERPLQDAGVRAGAGVPRPGSSSPPSPPSELDPPPPKTDRSMPALKWRRCWTARRRGRSRRR